MNFLDRVKQKVWHYIYKIFPVLERFFLPFHEKGRQRFHIGYLVPGRSLEDLKNHLREEWGFGNHFIAWEDDGQVLSWRKLHDFNNQYHIRVFEDGEIRGHYEYTPEGHPVAHFDEKNETFHRKEFLKFLGDFVTDKKTSMHLKFDPNAFDPASEISIENEKIAA